jgi:hypothetical protein
MMNSKQNTPTTTTEELIVQYLDGELVRKELETVLFDRLAHSDEARMLLREYLVVRGAIRVSRSDKQFQLSDDLDERTRARILQIMEAMAAEELLTPTAALLPTAALAEPIAKRGFKADRGAIASSPVSRQMKRWQLRGALAALSLLLAFGTVWLVTGTTNNRDVASLQPSQKTLVTPETPLAQTQPVKESATSVSGMTTPIVSDAKMHTPFHPHSTKNAMLASNRVQQNSMQANDVKVENPPTTTESQDPANDMILPRYGKAIDAASKHEIVVSGKDRL